MNKQQHYKENSLVQVLAKKKLNKICLSSKMTQKTTRCFSRNPDMLAEGRSLVLFRIVSVNVRSKFNVLYKDYSVKLNKKATAMN